jgi:hypothetical protein
VAECLKKALVKPSLQLFKLKNTAVYPRLAVGVSGVGRKHLYSRQISVRYHVKDQLIACPMKWLDSFSMRSFTNDSIFDDTLPVADGLMRVGTRVPLNRLKEADFQSTASPGVGLKR